MGHFVEATNVSASMKPFLYLGQYESKARWKAMDTMKAKDCCTSPWKVLPVERATYPYPAAAVTETREAQEEMAMRPQLELDCFP